MGPADDSQQGPLLGFDLFARTALPSTVIIIVEEFVEGFVVFVVVEYLLLSLQRVVENTFVLFVACHYYESFEFCSLRPGAYR